MNQGVKKEGGFKDPLRGRYMGNIKGGMLKLPEKFTEFLAGTRLDVFVVSPGWLVLVPEGMADTNELKNQTEKERGSQNKVKVKNLGTIFVNDQGQVPITEEVRRNASIWMSEVIIVGMLWRIEIWSTNGWEREAKRAEMELGKILKKQG